MKDFETRRLHVANWSAALADPEERTALFDALPSLLTPAVLQHLPPPLQPDPGPAGLKAWVAAREAESAVFTIRPKDQATLLGLVILAEMGIAERCEVHIGYFLSEATWGQGYASEVVKGLVQAFSSDPPTMLLGGVAKDNPASARVLEKAGFQRDASLSTSDTDMFTRLVGGV